MKIVLFYHSLVSDWNHGNAHFLRGVATELVARLHEVAVFEPADSWSRENLVRDHGRPAVDEFHHAYPGLGSTQFNLSDLDLERELDGADLVVVHEWNDPALVDYIGRWRASSRHARLLFHDTHHRSVTDPAAMSRYRLENYDGVLAFGNAVREVYQQRGWGKRVWTWHEAADTRVFRPLASKQIDGDLVWIGNWGDDERTAELHEFLFEPVRSLGLRARVHGVRYPQAAVRFLSEAGIEYGGWLPNFRAPQVFSRYRVTVHVPRRPYVEALPGIPTIRPFEAMACGIPLVSAPWRDAEGLFEPGRDYLVARDGAEMQTHLRRLLNDPALAAEIADRGRHRILSRHTCAHRVDELMEICGQIGVANEAPLTAGTV